MDGTDLRKLAVFLSNITIKEFALLYNQEIDSYLESKYKLSQKHTLFWLCELDHFHLEHLANMINHYED